MKRKMRKLCFFSRSLFLCVLCVLFGNIGKVYYSSGNFISSTRRTGYVLGVLLSLSVCLFAITTKVIIFFFSFALNGKGSYVYILLCVLDV